MVEWAHRFDCPIYLHADDRGWVQRPDPAIRFWEGEQLELKPGLTLLRLGGHFAGGTGPALGRRATPCSPATS